MTTLTLEIENPSILTHLKAVLKAIHGVKILNHCCPKKKSWT